jgi:hypothetical protein
MTDPPLVSGLRASHAVRAPSTRNGHEPGPVTALEPSEPTRAARRRLRLAVAARAAINHPNLIRARSVGEGNGRLFVAFEPCPHPSLAKLLAAGPLGPTECAHILAGAAAGVDALNERGLVARDLTPQRVFLDPEHGGVLRDLGIPPELLRRVPLDRDPELAFRSPEELERKSVAPRSAVYSLGAILLAALTALPPDAPARRSHRRGTLAPEIEVVVARAMARDPAERFASAEALSIAAVAALGADLGPKSLPSPHRNGRPSMTGPPTKDPLRIHGHRARQRRSAEVPRSPRPDEPRRRSRAAKGVTARFLEAVRRLRAVISALLALAETIGRRAYAGLRSSASALGRIASGVASLAAGAGRRAHHALKRVQRSAPSLARITGARISRFVHNGWKVASRLVGAGSAAERISNHRKLLLPAVGVIVASALSGIALAHAFEPGEGPSSVSRAVLAAQLPHGWEPADLDPVLPTFPTMIAAVSSGETGTGFLAGKISSLAAAERMLERLRGESDGRTHVRLGGLDAWQYAGLRPRPHVVGTGYLIPTAEGVVLWICHALTSNAPARLAECTRAASTLVIRGERPVPVSSADRSNERMVRVIATLRTSRSEGRRRLETAELGRGQARAATSLELSHQRAARSLDRVSALENGHSLGNLSAAARRAAAAYGRLADAASVGDRSAYRGARLAVVREEEALRRELARTGDA